MEEHRIELELADEKKMFWLGYAMQIRKKTFRVHLAALTDIAEKTLEGCTCQENSYAGFT